MFFALEGDDTLGRNESRLGRLLDVRDYCKLHIIAHYFSVLAGGERVRGGRCACCLSARSADDAGRARGFMREMAGGRDGHAASSTRSPGQADAPDRMLPVPRRLRRQHHDATPPRLALSAEDIERAGAAPRPRPARRHRPRRARGAARERDRMLALATKHGALRAASFASGEMAEAAARGMFSRVDVIAINEDEGAMLARQGLRPGRRAERFSTGVAAALRRFNAGMRSSSRPARRARTATKTACGSSRPRRRSRSLDRRGGRRALRRDACGARGRHAVCR